MSGEVELTREQFYALRDKRTRGETAGASIEAFRCEVLLSQATAATYATQTTGLLLTNVLARFCRTLRLVCPRVEVHPLLRGHPALSGAPNLLSALTREARAIDPFINLQPTELRPSHDGSHRIVVNDLSGLVADFQAVGHGWDVAMGTRLSGFDFALTAQDLHNPLGPAFAAFMAAADAFKVASGAHVDTRIQNHRMDLWAHDGRPGQYRAPDPGTIELGRSLLLGVGGVGSCLCHLLSLGRFRGDVLLVDHDDVDYTNLNRCLPFLFAHARAKRRKVRVCRELVEHSGLRAYAFPLKAREFFDVQVRRPGEYDQVYAVANEDGAYRSVQGSYPPTVMHASTSPNWQANCGRHEPLVDPCVVCELGGTDTVKFTCEDGVESTPNEKERPLGSLPFLAPLAGAMLLRMTIRRALGTTGGMIQSLNLRSQQPYFTSRQAMDVESCMCRQNHDVHQQFLAKAPSG